MSELDKQIKAIEDNIETIKSSSLPNGTKSDILDTLTKLQIEIKEIEPLYDNIDSLKKLLIEPTNKQIAESYRHFDANSKKSERKNNIFFIISFIFGLLGIALTILPIIQTGLQQTITYSYNDLDQIFYDFDWIRNIKYNYQKSLSVKSIGFELTSQKLDQLLKLEIIISNDYLSAIKDVSKEDQLIITKQIETLLSSYFGESVEITLIKYDNSYNGYEFLFSVYKKYLDIIEINQKKNDICAIVIRGNIDSFHKVSYKNINFGKQKEKFISDVCAFVYLLTGTKYCIHLESTIAPKYIRGFYDVYSQAIILVEIK
ncbi:hypothetical protein JO41_05320 [Treponema sp. OMZ 838]|uniref:hypothetical protein n=1 Tax=Treponema sp. OMZ 838 TaxID=1539298 RepID=UPI0005301428|nr:hypothetical protein [Treponema sp. OMZ 838]AIW89305.1 hypothetical protein JO41_05320 [Treponema sp. OMZ 838]